MCPFLPAPGSLCSARGQFNTGGPARRNTTAHVTVTATGGSGSFQTDVQKPKTNPAGAVVVIQEIFGVNQAMRDIELQHFRPAQSV